MIDSSINSDCHLEAMLIIPVLDVRAGQVVRAVGSTSRSAYAPLNSVWCPDASPYTLLDHLRDWLDAAPVYVADLDALQGLPVQRALWVDLAARYPELVLWIDVGATRLSDFETLGLGPACIPVIGSESLMDNTGLSSRQDWVASLDTRDGSWSGHDHLGRSPELWPRRLILMSLERIGSPLGPDLERLRFYREKWPNHEYFLAGGIRGTRDLDQATEAGATGVLVSSWLHQSTLGSPPWT